MITETYKKRDAMFELPDFWNTEKNLDALVADLLSKLNLLERAIAAREVSFELALAKIEQAKTFVDEIVTIEYNRYKTKHEETYFPEGINSLEECKSFEEAIEPYADDINDKTSILWNSINDLSRYLESRKDTLPLLNDTNIIPAQPLPSDDTLRASFSQSTKENLENNLIWTGSNNALIHLFGLLYQQGYLEKNYGMTDICRHFATRDSTSQEVKPFKPGNLRTQKSQMSENGPKDGNTLTSIVRQLLKD